MIKSSNIDSLDMELVLLDENNNYYKLQTSINPRRFVAFIKDDEHNNKLDIFVFSFLESMNVKKFMS